MSDGTSLVSRIFGQSTAAEVDLYFNSAVDDRAVAESLRRPADSLTIGVQVNNLPYKTLTLVAVCLGPLHHRT
jgi:hypothetical protein